MERNKLRQFVTVMEPPRHQVDGEDWKERMESRRKVLEETWEEAAAPLRDGNSGAVLKTYERLLKKKDRLEYHLEELQSERDKYRNQTKYFRALSSLWLEKMDELGMEPDDKISAGLPEKLKGNSINAQGRAEKETDDPRFGANRVHREGSDFKWLGEYSVNNAPSVDEWKLGLEPQKETLEQFGVDRNALLRLYQPTFKGEMTWREVIIDLKRRHKKYLARHREMVRTVEQITFRLSVLRNVLYQYEVLGEVESFSGEELDKAGEEPPISGHRAPGYALEAHEILKENPEVASFTALAAKWGVRGSSKVDTVKRGIGYDDLPKEEKSFGRFKEMLEERVQFLRSDLED